MNKKTLLIVNTAILIALLIAAQFFGNMLGNNQFVTGSLVNLILIVAAVYAGLWSGIIVAVISPVLAFMLGIAANPYLVPAIIIGNIVIVVLMHYTYKLAKNKEKAYWIYLISGIIVSALAKFAVLFVVVRYIIKGLIVPGLPAKIIAVFSFPQLFTALMGGFLSIAIITALKRANGKKS